MKLREIYETAVRMGIAADPRGKEGVEEFLARQKRRAESLPEHLKPLADSEELTNPFNDTASMWATRIRRSRSCSAAST